MHNSNTYLLQCKTGAETGTLPPDGMGFRLCGHALLNLV